MAKIIKQNLVIDGSVSYKEDIQIASGVTVTVKPGAVLDLGGFGILNYGTLILDGNDNNFASIKNGMYSTDSTSGDFQSMYGLIDAVEIDGFFSDGSINFDKSIIFNSEVDALQKNLIKSSIFIDSPFDLSIESAFVSKTTFLRSKIISLAWNSQGVSATFENVNFIDDEEVIYLDPFFSGDGFSHKINIVNGYINLSAGQVIDEKIFDADDTLKVEKNIVESSFSSSPHSNSNDGFEVGNTLIDWQMLGVSQNVTAQLSTADHLMQSFGLTVDVARNWVMNHMDRPAEILAVCQAGGVSASMLAEIVQPAFVDITVTGQVVNDWFNFHALSGLA